MKHKVILSLLITAMVISACANSELKEAVQNNDTANEVGTTNKKTQEDKEEAETSKEMTLPADSAMQSAAPSATGEINLQEVEKKYTDKVIQASGADSAEIRDSIVQDFDKNGTVEAFIFVGGEPDEMGAAQGKLYFVNDEKCEVVKESGSFFCGEEGMMWLHEVEDKVFVEVADAYVTSTVSYIYYVENDSFKESAVSGLGSFFEPGYVDDYCISLSSYDAFLDYEDGKESEGMYTGHTWKNYYFYYDKEAGDFAEYKGMAISVEDLDKACGFPLSEEITAEGYEIGDIYRRDNGIINANYSRTSKYEGMVSVEYRNVTYNEKTASFVDVWGDGENTWQGSDFGGTYEEAITE